MKFLEDFKALNDLSEEIFVKLIDQFNTQKLDSIASLASFEKYCEDEKIDFDKATKLYSILSFIIDFLISERDIVNGLEKFQTRMLKTSMQEVQEIWTLIVKNSSKLMDFIHTVKERQLRRIFNTLADFKLICDVRPLFDIERENIVRYTFPLLMSIKESSDRNSVIELTEEQLVDVQKEVDTAIRKLRLLKERFSNERKT